MQRKSFTLAEVLVTLMIVGIVASLTIPSLLQNIEDAKFRPNAKVAYSILAQAFTMMQADYNIPNFADTTPVTAHENVRNKFCDSMRCIQTGVSNQFFAPYYWYYKSSSGIDYSAQDIPAAILSNGMPVLFVNEGQDCQKEYFNLKTVCGYIYVDTNGKQSPNMFGKDYLLFWITRENSQYKVVPAGSGDGFICTAGSSDFATSVGCTKYYIDGRTLE